jgi:hypothetical protein
MMIAAVPDVPEIQHFVLLPSRETNARAALSAAGYRNKTLASLISSAADKYNRSKRTGEAKC